MLKTVKTKTAPAGGGTFILAAPHFWNPTFCLPALV